MISFLVGRKNGPRVEIPKPPQRKSQKNLGAKSRKALKSKDFEWESSSEQSSETEKDLTPFFYLRHRIW